MPVTSTLLLAYFDLSHAAPYLPQCPVMLILIITAAVAVAVWAAGGRAPGGRALGGWAACRTGLRGRPLFGASLSRAGLLGPLCCWTGLVLWRSWRQRERERRVIGWLSKLQLLILILLLQKHKTLPAGFTHHCVLSVQDWDFDFCLESPYLSSIFMIIINKYWNSDCKQIIHKEKQKAVVQRPFDQKYSIFFLLSSNLTKRSESTTC